LTPLSSVFGLVIQADRRIPGLTPLLNQAEPDVLVYQEGFPPWMDELRESQSVLWHVAAAVKDDQEPAARVWQVGGGEYLILRYDDGIEFAIDRRGTRVWIRTPEGATPEEVAIYLLGPILGLLLRFRHITCLHGSAVAVGQKAVGFLGRAGAGKSTIAAAFAHQGFPILSDDILALRYQGGKTLVLPGPPRLCLWPRSVDILYGTPEMLPRLVPENSLDSEWDKRAMDFRSQEYTYQESPLPLAAIYILDERQHDAGPAVEAISPADGMMALVSNSYRTEWLDKTMRESEFKVLSRIMEHVPLRRLIPHADPSYLFRLCEITLEDFQALSAAVC
jgi:hypothetical protein